MILTIYPPPFPTHISRILHCSFSPMTNAIHTLPMIHDLNVQVSTISKKEIGRCFKLILKVSICILNWKADCFKQSML